LISSSKPKEEARDQFGATKALRDAIDQRYEIIELIGAGSYGHVSRGRCRETGRQVALKVLINQADTEYNAIKLVREIQLITRLNKISDQFLKH